MDIKRKQQLLSVVGMAVIGVAAWLAFLLLRSVWREFVALNPSLAVGLLTAATTVLVATLTVVLGRYFERKKEVESHFREKKTEIYDPFLKEFFKLFHNPEKDGAGDHMAAFLWEWQRQMILWGGTDVLVAFMKWRTNPSKGVPDAQSMLLTDEFFRAVRRDLGPSNSGLERGAFIRMILRHPDVFFVLANANPNVTLAELAAKEKELGLDG